MSTLHIRLFGQFAATWRDRSATVQEIRLPRSAQALLGYLLLHRQQLVPRDVLVEIFWHDSSPEQARSCLSTAVWRLRRRLKGSGQEGGYLLSTPEGEIGFNPASSHWLDVAVFEEVLTRLCAGEEEAITPALAQEAEEALALYTGDLLEGWYADWALRERERLRLLYVRGLQRLMRWYKGVGNLEASILCGQRILEKDLLREEIHRELMRLYAANGQRAQAVRQYQACRQALIRELEMEPMEETRRLYQAIRQEPVPAWTLPVSLLQQARLPDGAAQLDDLLQDLLQVQQQVLEANQRLEAVIRTIQALDRSVL